MAGNVVPGASGMMLRRFAHAAPAQIPHAQMPHSSMPQQRPRSSGGIGGGGMNPMKPQDLQYDEQGAILPPGGMGRPGTVSGIIGRMMDKADQADYEKRLGAAHNDKTSKIQSAFDTYDKALAENGGNRADAARQVAMAENHKYFLDPDVWNAVGTYHGLKASGSDEGYSIKPIGGGYSVLSTPDGNQVVQDRSVAGKVMNIKGVGPATINVDPSTGQATITPAKMAGGEALPEQYTTKPTVDSDKRLQAASTVLRNLDDMRASGGAVGSLGWGYLERLAATGTGIPAPVAATYNAAYNQMVPALLTMNRAVGANTRGEGNLNQLQLPKPTQAAALTLGQTLPRIEDLSRQVISQLWTEAHSGKWANFPEIDAMAKTYGATPTQMHLVADARHQLMTDPAGLKPDQLTVLRHEFANGRLPLNVQEETAAAMGWQGFIDAPTAAKMGEIYPGLADKMSAATPEGQMRMPRDPNLRKGLNPGVNPSPTPIPPQQPITPPVQSAVPPGQAQPGEKPALTGPTGIPLSPTAPAPQVNAQPAPAVPGQHPTGENPLNAPPTQPSIASRAAGFIQSEAAKTPQSPNAQTPEQMYGGVAPPAAPGTPASPVSAQPEPQGTATIPPALGKQSSIMDLLNPIGSAQAAEMPPVDKSQLIPPEQAIRDLGPTSSEQATEPTIQMAQATAQIPPRETASATADIPEASASAAIPPRNPIGEAATADIPKPGFEEKATALFHQIRGLLDQYKQDQ